MGSSNKGVAVLPQSSSQTIVMITTDDQKNEQALEKIAFPHDTFFRESLTQVAIARDLFQHNLPAHVLKTIDLNTLKLQPTSFVRKSGKSSFKDIVYQVNIKDKPGRLFALWEHQSRAEPWMPLRIHAYLIDFFLHCVKQGFKQLPPVICCLFYHGKPSPYPYSCDLFELFEDTDWARHHLLQPFHLVDLTQKHDEELLGHGKAAILEVLQKNIRERDIRIALEKLKQGGCLTSIAVELGDYLRFVIKYILQEGDSPDKDAIVHFLSDALPEHKEHIMNIAQQFRQEGLERGLVKGRQAERLAIAKTMLSDQADLQTVARYTHLSLEELEKLQRELNH